LEDVVLVKDEAKPKYDVKNETAVPWKSLEWTDFYQEFMQSLTSNLNVTEQEAAAVGRLLVSLSAWREEGMGLALSMSQLEEEELCKGVEEWRDKVLYIRHGVGCICPLHGQGENGRRIAVYIGKKEHNQVRAKNAITRQGIHNQLLKKSAHLAAMADQVGGMLVQVAKKHEVM